MAKNAKKQIVKSGKSQKTTISLPPLPAFNFTKGFFILIGIAFILRIIPMITDALYYDEVLCKKDALALPGHIKSTPHFLHFFILRFFLKINQSDFFLRLAPFIMSLFSIAGVYYLGQFTRKKEMPLILASLFTFSEYINFYSIDADYYSAMMLYTIISIISVIGFLKYYRWYFFYLLILMSIMNYFTHPASALFSGASVLMLILYSFLDKETRSNVYSLKSTSNIISLCFLGFCIVIGIPVVFMKMGSLLSLPQTFLKSIKFASWAHNMDFSLYFFFMTFKQYGPSLLFSNIITYILTPVFAILFILGLVSFKKNKSPLFWLIIINIILTYIILFNTGVNRFFHIRYTSFIAVVYLIGIGEGLRFIGEIISAKSGDKKIAGAAMPVFIAIIFSIFCLAPTTAALILKDFGNWKNAMNYFIKQNPITKDSRIFVYNENDYVTARHYINEYKSKIPTLSESNLVWTNHFITAQQDISFRELKNTLFKYPDTYFISHWTEYGTTYQPITKWVENNFVKVVDAPSKNEISLIQYYRPETRKTQQETAPHQSVKVYKWKYPGTYLLYPETLKIDLSKNIDSDNLKVNTDNGIIKADIKLYVDKPYAWRFEIQQNPSISLPSDTFKNFMLNGTSQDIANNNVLLLTEGENKVTFEMTQPSDIKNLSLSISTALASSLKLTLNEFSNIFPSQDVKLKAVNDKNAISFTYYSTIDYSFSVPEDGVYDIMVESVNDKPSPILWVAGIDSQIYTILNYSKLDNSIEMKQFAAELKKGMHQLNLFYISEGNATASDADLKTEGLLCSIEIKHSNAAEGKPAFTLSDINITENETSSALAPGWFAQPGNMLSSVFRDENNKACARLSISPDNNGGTLISPPSALSANLTLFYFEMKIHNLNNHSANAYLIYFNKDKQPAANNLITQRGITRNTDWTKFIALVPPNKHYSTATIAPAIYKNGKVFSPENGEIEVRNFRVFK